MVEKKESPKETLIAEPIYSKDAYLNNGQRIGRVENFFIDLKNKRIKGIYIKNGTFEKYFSRDEILDIIKNKVILRTSFITLNILHQLKDGESQ